MRLLLHHPMPTEHTTSLKGDPTPRGMAWKAPSGLAWQDLWLGEHLNGCFWNRLSALLNNTRITKQAFDWFIRFSVCRGSLIRQIFARHTLLSWSFCVRKRHLVGVERRKLKIQKENLTRLLLLFENPKYMHAWVSWLDRNLNPSCMQSPSNILMCSLPSSLHLILLIWSLAAGQ